MGFAEKMAKAMKAQGLCQKDISDRTGISKTCISGYMHGAGNPAPERRRQIAEALGLSADYFEDQQDPESIPKMTVEEAARIMGVSPPTVRSGLKDRVFPWGYAIETESGAWVYWINRNKFFKMEG